MINKASSKTRTNTKKKASAKTGTDTGKRASARRAPAVKATSSALDLEDLFSTTQSRLVGAWQKDANAAVKALEGLRKKLDRAVERQRKLKDKRIAAAMRYREKRSAATGARLEKAKLAYTEATAVVAEFRDLAKAARERVKAAKLGLARALARDKILARFARDYDKAQAAKTNGTRRKTRKTAQRIASQSESSLSDEAVQSTSGADQKEDESIPDMAESASN